MAVSESKTSELAQGLARELRHTESVADAWKAETERIRAAVYTPFVSLMTYDEALDRLREINGLCHGVKKP